MDDWEKFNETSLPGKDDFYSHLDMEDIIYWDYAHAKRVCKTFEKKNLGKYHDFCLQSNTSLLADVFENFRNICTKIYELDPAKFLSAPGLAWQTALKKTNVKLDLLVDIDVLVMVQKGRRGWLYHSICRYTKANDKYMKDYDRNKESSYILYWDVNNLNDWTMSQKLPVSKFDRIKDTFEYTKDVMKN